MTVPYNHPMMQPLCDALLEEGLREDDFRYQNTFIYGPRLGATISTPTHLIITFDTIEEAVRVKLKYL